MARRPPAASGNSRKDETINYEVDKTVRYTQQPMGGVRRLTVAVVVNYKRTLDNTGKIVMRPDRGRAQPDHRPGQGSDGLQQGSRRLAQRGQHPVQHRHGTGSAAVEAAGHDRTGQEIGKYVLVAAVLLFLYFRVLRPIVWKLSGREERERLAKEKAEAEAAAAAAAVAAGFDPDDPDAIVNLSGEPAVDERAPTRPTWKPPSSGPRMIRSWWQASSSHG
jgi:flagellar M-ring protein FliF